MRTSTVELGEICAFTYGDGLKEEKRRPGKVPVFGSNGIVGWHDKALTNGPTIIIGRKGSIGEVNWSEGPCYPIDTTYFVEKTKQPCDLKWLYYALLQLDLTRLNKSAAVPGLNRDDAYEQHVVFPPLPEQQRIAGQLEQADRLRRTRRYALELSESLPQSIFRSMFCSAEKSCKKVDLEEVAADSVYSLSSGPFGSSLTSAHYVEHGVPVLRGLNVSAGRLSLDDLKYVSDEKAAELVRSEARPGDIVVVAVGSSGLACRVTEELPRAIMSQNFNKITPDTNKVDGTYLVYCINSPVVQGQFGREITDTVRTFLSLTKLRTVRIPLPLFSLQQAFAGLVERVERLRAVQRESLRQAEHLFQSLLHRAFTTGL